MKTVARRSSHLVIALLIGLAAVPPARAEAQAGKASAWAPVVNAKPLGEHVRKGLGWIVEHQLPSGGWGQGEESAGMRGQADLRDLANVGDTCAAVLALLRSGSTAAEGPYAEPIRRGLAFVCEEIERADRDSLYVTEIRGTRLQGKLGAYIDTFLASLVLAEVRGTLPTPAETARVEAAQAKVMRKIEKNQREDGSFGGAGWANALSQGLAAKSVNRAAQAGYEGSEVVRERIERRALSRIDASSGRAAADDAAGVELYAVGASLGTMQDSDNTNKERLKAVREQADKGDSPEIREQAQKELERYEDTAKALAATRAAVVERLDDKAFVSGFGSNGGEEFLSYMNIGESLVVEGGEAWQKWDREISANLARIQNEDGSWTGHHCITGRSFCTAAALLVLMTDRAPVPLSAGLTRR